MYRVQFQMSLSLTGFLKHHGTEEACEVALVRQSWGAGFVCVRCGGALFAHGRLPPTKWILAIYLLVQTKTNLAPLELMRHLNVFHRTALRLKHKLLMGMENARESTRLSGFVQIDDPNPGGELTGGTLGRGSEIKVPFVIAVSATEDDTSLLVVAFRLSGFSGDAIRTWAQACSEPERDVCSVGHAHTVQTAKRRDAAQAPAMRWVITVLSNIKRSIDGSYHAFRSKKFGQRNLSEAMWRVNRRLNRSTLASQLICVHCDAVNCQPWTEKHVRNKLTAY